MMYKRVVFFTGLVGAVLFLIFFNLRPAILNQTNNTPLPAPTPDMQPEDVQASHEVHTIKQTLDAGNIEEAIRLAKIRGARMKELIQRDPEQAIQAAISLAEWTELPQEIQAHIEKPFSERADINVTISCGHTESTTVRTTDFSDGSSLDTYVYGARAEMTTKTGIPIQGIRIDSVSALREKTFQQLTPADEEAARTLYPVAMGSPTPQAIPALAGGKRFYFENEESLNQANQKMAELNALPGPNTGAKLLFDNLEAFLIKDESIDLVKLEQQALATAHSWTGTPRDMYVILVDFSDDPGQPTDPVAFENSLNTTVSQQIWEMSYEKTHIVAFVNPTTYRMPQVSTNYLNDHKQLHDDAVAAAQADGVDLTGYETVCVYFTNIGYRWAGLATLGGMRMWLNGYTNPETVTHELGHNYGSGHASTWVASGSDPVGPGSLDDYGDETDIMGDGAMPEGHFNTYIKKRVGWFDANNWMNVSNSGTYRIYRSDHRQTTGLLRGLEIDKGNDEYWVGFRQEYPGLDTFSRGAYLLWKKYADNRSYLLDLAPQTSGDPTDGGLGLGQTYSDATAQVHITPVARGGQTPNEWMDVVVNLGNFPGNAAPTANSISGPNSLAARQSGTFSVSASDPNGDELAYHWNIGDGVVHANAPTVSLAWMSGSSATVTCTISDMKGGTKVLTKNVTLSDPLSNWSQRTSGTTVGFNDIATSGSRLVAVTTDGQTLYSDNGNSWTSHSNFDVWEGNIELKAVMHDGSKFVACGDDYDFNIDPKGWEGTIYTSTDGSSWTERYDANVAGSSLNDVAYGNGVYVAIGNDGRILRSTNGTNWTPVTSGTTTDLKSVSYGDGFFVVIGDEGGFTPHVVLTSSNGSSWTDQSAGTTLPDGNWLVALAYCHDRFLAGGWNAEILYSTNAGSSFSQAVGGSLDMKAFAYGKGVYLTGGIDLDDNDNVVFFSSVDGANWSPLTTPHTSKPIAAVFYNNTFITVGESGEIWQSGVANSSSGYAAWSLDNRDALGADRDPQDDADFDGHNNLYEYALGSSATDPTDMPSGAMTDANGTWFTASFPRKAKQPDINYKTERAVNLTQGWSDNETVLVADEATNLTVRSAFTMDSQTDEFLRLKLNLQ